MEKILIYFAGRFKEHSSWYGLILVAMSFGLKLSPEQQQALIYFGMAMAAAPDVNLKKPESKAVEQQAQVQRSTKGTIDEDSKKSINDILSDDN